MHHKILLNTTFNSILSSHYSKQLQIPLSISALSSYITVSMHRFRSACVKVACSLHVVQVWCAYNDWLPQSKSTRLWRSAPPNCPESRHVQECKAEGWTGINQQWPVPAIRWWTAAWVHVFLSSILFQHVTKHARHYRPSVGWCTSTLQWFRPKKLLKSPKMTTRGPAGSDPQLICRHMSQLTFNLRTDSPWRNLDLSGVSLAWYVLTCGDLTETEWLTDLSWRRAEEQQRVGSEPKASN